MKKLHFIVNKLSPQVKIVEETVVKEIDHTRFSVVFKYSEYQGHAIELAKAAVNEGVSAVVACGGDGTINEIARCLVHTDTALAILPIGSGNGLARHLQIPIEISKALQVLQRFDIKKMDVGQADERYFFCNVSFAFSAQVIHCYDTLPNRGFKAYSKAFLKAISIFKYKSFQLDEQANKTSSTPFVFLISNTDQLGYNRTLTPNASLFDGKLDAIRVERYNPVFLCFFMLFAFFRKFPPFTKVHRSQFKDMSISCQNGPINIQIDGEKIETEKQDIHISLNSNALNVVC